MKKPFLSVTKLSVITVAGIGFASLFIPQPSLAQFTNQIDRGTNQNTDPSATPNSGDFNNVFDLMHRLKFGNLTWDANQQEQKLDSAASDFRARQRKAFQERQQQQSNTDSPPSSGKETEVR